jgi:hypothetical protein
MWDQVKEALQQSASRVLTSLASILPGLVAMLVAVLLASLIGGLMRVLFGRALRGVRFDERVERLGFGILAEFSPERSPSRLVGLGIFWLVMFLGLVVGFAAIAPAETERLLGAILGYLPNVVVASLLLVIGALVARFLGRSVLIGAVNLQVQSAKLLSIGVKWMVMSLAAVMALNHLHIGGEVLTLAFGILFGGIVLALALAVGLGSKEVVRKSLERQVERRDEPVDAPLEHL